MSLPLTWWRIAVVGLILTAMTAALASPAMSASAPAKPSTPTVSDVTLSSIKLSWPSVNGASSYRLYWGTKSDGTGRTRLDVSGTSATITGMLPNTKYYVRMAARNSAGATSAYTNDATAMTKRLTTPDRVQADRVMATSFRVTWDRVPGVSTYRLYWGTNPDGTGRTRVDVGDVGAITLGNLTPETTYYVRMAARANEESSTYSADVVATPTRQLATPAGVEASNVTATGVRISWDQVASADFYRVYWGTNPDGTGRTGIDTGSTSVSLPALDPGTRYYVRLASKRSNGTGSGYSEDVSWRTTEPFGTPKDVTIIDARPTQMTLTWSPVGDAASYRLYWGTNPNGTGRTRLDVDGTTATITGMSPSTTYYVRMAARKADGETSTYSDDVSADTAAPGTVGAPLNVAIAEVASRNFTVKWTPVSGVAGYRLYWGTNPDGTGRTRVDVEGAASESVVIAGLDPNVRYYVRMASRTAAGASSAYSSDVSAKTLPPTSADDINIASYNVRANNDSKTDGHRWNDRRQAVWDLVNSRQPDVIGFQEASQSALDGTSTSAKKFYFKDVVSGLPGYRLTNESAYNCVNDWSPMHPASKGDSRKRCYGDQVVDQGASAGTRIVYNGETMRMISSGSKLLSDISETLWKPAQNKNTWNDRYMAWAVLERRESGRQMFFVNTHLTDGESQGAERARQARVLRQWIAELNVGDLPVVVVGDFNTYPFQNAGADYRAVIQPFKDDGYRDPLGTQANTVHRATTGLAESFTGHPNCDSYTGFRRKLPLGSAPIDGQKDCWYSAYDQTQYNGNNIDYIFTRGVSRVKQWETVINLDANGNIVGVIPSDHHMIRAVVTLS